MQVAVDGKRWNFRFAPNLGARGDCDPPNWKQKEIRVSSSLVGEEQLEVTIHELLHASCWPLSEEYVTRFAEDAARALWRLGYRREQT